MSGWYRVTVGSLTVCRDEHGLLELVDMGVRQACRFWVYETSDRVLALAAGRQMAIQHGMDQEDVTAWRVGECSR